MHDYNTILGVIELRLSKVSYDTVQKRYAKRMLRFTDKRTYFVLACT